MKNFRGSGGVASIVLATFLAAGLAGCAGGGSAAKSDQTLEPVGVAVSNEAFLEAYAATYRFSLGRPKSIAVAPEGDAVFFLRSGPRSQVQDLYEFDVASGQERVLLSAETLLGGGAENLSEEEKARRERMRMASRGIASYVLSKDGKSILVPLSGRLFLFDRATGSSRELPAPVGTGGYAIDPQLSRDATMVAAVRDGDVWVQSTSGGAARRITPGASGTIVYGEAEFVAQEEMGRFHGFWWNADGSKICYQGADTAGMPIFHIADPVNPDASPRDWPYPRAGTTNARVWLEIAGVSGGAPVRVNWDSSAFPYLANVVWPKNGPLTILVQNREQTRQQLLAVNDATGETRLLIDETDAAWLNISESCPKWTDDGSAFIWLTESSGERTVELRRNDGSLIGPLTAPGSGVADVLALDSGGSGKRGWVYVSASNDATQSHVWRIPLNAGGGNPQRLTSERGLHGASVGEDGTMVIASQTYEGAVSWDVRKPDGTVGGKLTNYAEMPGFKPGIELTQVPAAKGVVCHAAIVRPQRFDPKAKYPVIASVYAGPTSQTVRANPWQYTLHQWMADQGFIVVCIDGRGTPGRGRAWERAWKELDPTGKGNLIDVALDDQAAAIQELCRRYPEMDGDRVGVSGWSFGGYFAAMAVMRRPDVYKAGVAGAPVADWRDYDTHYTERYLGLPDANAAGYDASSVLTYCKDLTRPLLIIHGTADDNVYFMHSLKMTEALFRNGKRFEFLPLAGFTHMVPDAEVVIRLQSRMMDFFQRELK